MLDRKETAEMYAVGGKLLYGMKSMHVNGLACVRVKEVRGSAKRVYHVPLTFQYINGCSDEGKKKRVGDEGSNISGRWERVNIPWPLLCR